MHYNAVIEKEFNHMFCNSCECVNRNLKFFILKHLFFDDHLRRPQDMTESELVHGEQITVIIGPRCRVGRAD